MVVEGVCPEEGEVVDPSCNSQRLLFVGTFRDFLIRVVVVKDEGGAGQ